MRCTITINNLHKCNDSRRKDGDGWHLTDSHGSTYRYTVSNGRILITGEVHSNGGNSNAWWMDQSSNVHAPEGIVAICMIENKQVVTNGSRIKSVQPLIGQEVKTPKPYNR